MKSKSQKRREALDRAKKSLAALVVCLNNAVKEGKTRKLPMEVASNKYHQDSIRTSIAKSEAHIEHLEELVAADRPY